jgi:predicted TIM-barrel fold metal-dependent hydrolase
MGIAFEGDEEAHCRFLQDVARKAWDDKLPVKIVPLMMDILYMFDSPVYPQQKAEFRSSSYDKGGALDDDARPELEFALMDAGLSKDKAQQIADDIEPCFDKGFDDDPVPYANSKGFAEHRKALAKLQSEHPDTVFPFFAVDPRRNGVVQAVINGDFVGKGKSFRGVKLYPRLGYHPCCVDLEPLFKWCEDNFVPIITHCGPIGFPPFNDNYSDFGAPSSFRKVLENHKKLIIDFAHFGTLTPAWADDIVDFMDLYENVYSDLACYEKASELAQFKLASWTKGKVKDRTMFGTDYSMMYFFKVASLEDYYSNFKNAFTKTDLLRMDDVAARFLNS